MSRTILDQAAQRIAEHATAHALAEVRSCCAAASRCWPPGADQLPAAVIRGAVPPGTKVDLRVQTNAVTLDTAYSAIQRLDVRVGVSLGGGPPGQDRHRRRRGGRGSHAEVSAALHRLASGEFRHLFRGLLCTIDIRNDPLATYEALLDFQPPTIDFLLPHGNRTAPPPGRPPGGADTPYASWLIPVFDRWYRSPRVPTSIRLFAEIMHMLLGGPSATEAVGLSPVAVLVIETDGSIQGEDVLKSAYPGAPAMGLHISRDTLDGALLEPSVAARQIGVQALCEACRSCPVHRICGGGLYAHRYRAGTGFANPSVYSPTYSA